ncbi:MULTISPECIES: FAD-dependent oxidoreductase [unclassified Microbacterium]|uniref:NAD(P)/FAD-dependent oxidoreductase n=1 Tax=unclassified Microbacterium TaxID=2609290 RepID=UPI0028AF3733|nr:FAD-dependent oxidoreductase [Microbacterium sp.]
MPKILIVGGGYAGFYTAWKLEKHLRKGEADVTMVDPLPYMTYQPFLPEVAAGSIEARHSVVAHRRHLKRTHVLTAKVTNINHAQKVATITPPVGEPYEFAYDQIVVTAGAVSRTFPIPGIADNAIGLKTIEEAVAIRDKVMSNFDKAASLPAGPERDRLLTVVVVGGGFAGIEVFAELRSLASSLVSKYPQLSFEDTHFHLIEAMGRIMPEVSLKTSEWVLKDLAKRGANVHLDTQVTGAIDGNVELSTGEVIPTDVIVWTAGVMANPTVVRGGDLPVEERGRIQTRADLRVGTAEAFVEGAWAAGDVSAVPDLSGGGVGGFCVPNAQHAVRQAKLLAKNVVAVLRGESPKEYFHKNLGAVAGLGLYNGVFQSGKIALKGFIAWLAHRGYHGLAMPTWERKWRVLWGWWNNLWLGRDLVNLQTVQNPRYVFEEFAARPRPAAPADTAPASGAPAAKAPAAEKPAAAPAAETPAEIKKPAAKRPAAKKAPASSSKDSAETAAAK